MFLLLLFVSLKRIRCVLTISDGSSKHRQCGGVFSPIMASTAILSRNPPAPPHTSYIHTYLDTYLRCDAMLAASSWASYPPCEP